MAQQIWRRVQQQQVSIALSDRQHQPAYLVQRTTTVLEAVRIRVSAQRWLASTALAITHYPLGSHASLVIIVREVALELNHAQPVRAATAALEAPLPQAPLVHKVTCVPAQ